MPTQKPSDESGVVESQIRGTMATVRSSRPQKGNAFDSSLAERVAGVLESLAENTDLALVVLRSDGPIYCAGWDLDEIQSVRTSEQASALVGSGRRCLRAIDRLPQVVVSVVEHSSLGFGVAMLAHSDLTIVSNSARILLPELRHGIVPASVLGDLVAKVGRARALRWCLAGEVPLDEAVTSGLVSEVVGSERFEAEIKTRVEAISLQVPAAVHATKRLSSALRGDQSAIYAQGDAHAVSMLSAGVES